ncbi:unnamed protein product [Auanema sp. JU1783]|nr:unnamed protein product [Auanema sp. JU1783]
MSISDENETLTNKTEPCIPSGLIDIQALLSFVHFADSTVVILSILSSFLQFYVIRQAFSHIRRGNGDQCLHVFLLSMTIGDLLLTSVCYPLEYIPALWDFHLPRQINVTMHFLAWVALSGSSISLILLNLEKLLYFKYPLSYSSYVTRKRGVRITIGVWVACFVFVSGCWFFDCFNCVEDHCGTLALLPQRTMMYIMFSISVCITPTLTSLMVALYILKIVSSHRKKLAEEQALYSMNTTSVSHAIASRLRTFYFIFMTTVFTAATLLPYRLYQIKLISMKDSANTNEVKHCTTLLEMWTMSYLIAVNAILNPLLTVTVLPQYRCRAVSRLFGTGTNSEHKPIATEM